MHAGPVANSSDGQLLKTTPLVCLQQMSRGKKQLPAFTPDVQETPECVRDDVIEARALQPRTRWLLLVVQIPSCDQTETCVCREVGQRPELLPSWSFSPPLQLGVQQTCYALHTSGREPFSRGTLVSTSGGCASRADMNHPTVEVKPRASQSASPASCRSGGWRFGFELEECLVGTAYSIAFPTFSSYRSLGWTRWFGL